MTRRPSGVPGMPGKRALILLPGIPDDVPEALKDGLAIRNACATEGRCPGCGATGQLHADRELDGVFHYVFAHEPGCGACTDGEAA